MDQGQPGGEPERGDDVPAVPAALAAVARLREAVAEVLAAPLWPLSDGDVRVMVDETFAAMNQSFAGYLRPLLELDSRPGAVEGARPGAGGRTYLVHALNRSPFQASADLWLAKALAPGADPAHGGLPRLGAALAAGQVSREHAHVAVKALHRVPGDLLGEPMTTDEVAACDLADELPGPASDAEAGDAEASGLVAEQAGPGQVEADQVEADQAGPDQAEAGGRGFCRGDLLDRLLTDHSKRSDPGTIDKLGQYLQHAADPDGERSFDPEGTQRRGLTIVRDSTGMEIIRGELDAANGAFFRAALDALSTPCPARTEQAEDGTLIEVKDQRTARQRRADAAGTMARLALGQLATGRGSEPPRIVIHTSIDELRAAQAAASAPAPAGDARPTASGPAVPSDAPGPAVPSDAPGPAAAAADPAGSATPCPATPRPAARGAEFAGGGKVPALVLNQLACDALLERALLDRNGAILNLGRSTRTVSPAQRRALTARDRGCQIPGCTAPAHWCDGHHARWWQRDAGPTDINKQVPSQWCRPTCGMRHLSGCQAKVRPAVLIRYR